ncbi:MAG TPA: enterotoxin [Candidatus Sulfopaludibacter sp.]|jgi:hypothetical protein|nr:enterotoxin [Candidatus Sulfopaludibacter sp.]
MNNQMLTPTRRDLARWLAALALPRTLAAQHDSAQSRTAGDILTLSNAAISASWRVAGGRLQAVSLLKQTPPPDVFQIALAGGRTLKSSELPLAAAPKFTPLAPDAASVRRAGKRAGRQLAATFRDPDTGATFQWRAILLDDTRYLRCELTLSAGPSDLPVREIALWDLDLPGAAVIGKVKGSPAVAGTLYAAFEHPLSTTTLSGTRVHCSLTRQLPIRAGQSFACSSVAGSVRDGQLRRDFLEYVEDQRAHPYRTFLHYNTWYDIGYFSKFDEAAALDRVNFFGRELAQKRGVKLDSYLFDDGWDDPASLWSFHSGFPQGFTNIVKAAAQYKAGVGVWMSPWGGYGKPKQDRIRLGREQGFEIEDGGFALSGPKYYNRFREVCHKMISDFGVNQFKFDGTGNANRVSPGSQFDSDFDAAIHLIGDLRKQRPDLYVNLTTGTYPSPFWLRYADSIWRGGEDHDFAGVGSWRQKWITYRDADTYKNVVTAGPLFPVNSLMLHGMIYASKAKNLNTDPDGDFRSEIRDYFGTGTQLQEMYISPDLLSARNWDDLAEAARWSRGNAATLVDTHWIGGDPAHLEPYGWASWSPSKAIVTLRNPSDKPLSYSLDVEKALELPSKAPQRYRAASPWKEPAAEAVNLQPGKPHEVRLEPFQVLTLELRG